MTYEWLVAKSAWLIFFEPDKKPIKKKKKK